MKQPAETSQIAIPAIIRLLISSLAIAFFLGVGLAVAAVAYQLYPEQFASTATILIEPRSNQPATFNIRHDQLIAETTYVNQMLSDYGLDQLPSLTDLPTEQQVASIHKGLEITAPESSDPVYLLRFYSLDANDAQTILATLIANYERILDQRYDGPPNPEALMTRMLA